MKTTLLTTVNTAFEAHLIKGMLNNNGIECMITNENVSTILPHYNNMLGGGIRIVVAEEEFEKALLLLNEHPEPEL